MCGRVAFEHLCGPCFLWAAEYRCGVRIVEKTALRGGPWADEWKGRLADGRGLLKGRSGVRRVGVGESVVGIGESVVGRERAGKTVVPREPNYLIEPASRHCKADCHRGRRWSTCSSLPFKSSLSACIAQ